MISGFLMFVILAVATDARAVGEAAASAIGEQPRPADINSSAVPEESV